MTKTHQEHNLSTSAAQSQASEHRAVDNQHSDVAIIIPSRLGSVRLARKALEMIGNHTMVEHVARQVKKTGLANIYVATDSQLIADKVTASGVEYIMTSDQTSSGTDRVHEAFQLLANRHSINYIINVQGDMPFVDPATILQVINSLKASPYGIMTPAVKVKLEAVTSSDTVKIVVANNDRALYFSRSLIPHGASEFLYHIGIYGFRKDTLEQFKRIPPSKLEQSEKLEQLRALENNIDIGICYVPNIELSVDVQADLDKARAIHDRKN